MIIWIITDLHDNKIKGTFISEKLAEIWKKSQPHQWLLNVECHEIITKSNIEERT